MNKARQYYRDHRDLSLTGGMRRHRLRTPTGDAAAGNGFCIRGLRGLPWRKC
jgi:hypothetical protein